MMPPHRTRNDVLHPSVLLNECPTVVGSMALVINGGGSLEGAIRKVASDGPSESRGIFSEIVADADTRVDADMRTALGNRLSSLPEGASAYAMAVRMVMSASTAHDPTERSHLLDEARSTALTGLREAGKMYSSSLNMPCMVVFGVGIMVPMVLMSVLPMLKVSGSFGAAASMDPLVVSLITLLLIPAFVCGVMIYIREKNPFRHRASSLDLRPALPLLSAVPMMLVLMYVLRMGFVTSLCLSFACAGLLTFALLSRGASEERVRGKRCDLLKEAVFDTGNYLMSGMPFESSFREAVSSRPGCSCVARSMTAEMTLCRGDCRGAVVKAISPTSSEMADVYADVYSASTKDVRGSGNLAHSLGRQIMDQESVRHGIRAEMKSITDTMFGTAMVFAPLVLGLCVSILAPLSKITSGVDVSGTSTILSVYLIELCSLISVMLALLDGNESVLPVVRRLSLMLPVSLVVFLVTSSFSI